MSDLTSVQQGHLDNLLAIVGDDYAARERIKHEFGKSLDTLLRDMKCQLRRESFCCLQSEQETVWLRPEAKTRPFLREIVVDARASEPTRFGQLSECEIVAYSKTTSFTRRLYFVFSPLSLPDYIDGYGPIARDHYGGKLIDPLTVRARGETKPAVRKNGGASYLPTEQKAAQECRQFWQAYSANQGDKFSPVEVSWLPEPVQMTAPKTLLQRMGLA